MNINFLYHFIFAYTLFFASIVIPMDPPKTLETLNYACNPANFRTTFYDCSGNAVHSGISRDSYKNLYKQRRINIFTLLSSEPVEVTHNNSSHLLLGASYSNDIEVAKMLLEKGANPNLLDHRKIPHFFSIVNLELANLFFEYGADIKLSHDYYPNALWYPFVSSNKKNAIISLFLQKGIDPNKVNGDGDNLLHHIANNANHCVHIKPGEDKPSERYFDFIKAIKSILNNINHNTIDAKNNRHQTPIDILNSILKKRDESISCSEKLLDYNTTKYIGCFPDARQSVESATLNKDHWLEFMQLFLNFKEKRYS